MAFLKFFDELLDAGKTNIRFLLMGYLLKIYDELKLVLLIAHYGFFCHFELAIWIKLFWSYVYNCKVVG